MLLCYCLLVSPTLPATRWTLPAADVCVMTGDGRDVIHVPNYDHCALVRQVSVIVPLTSFLGLPIPALTFAIEEFQVSGIHFFQSPRSILS